MAIPEVAFGAATFSQFYNAEATLAGDTPIRTVRLALRYVLLSTKLYRVT